MSEPLNLASLFRVFTSDFIFSKFSNPVVASVSSRPDPTSLSYLDKCVMELVECTIVLRPVSNATMLHEVFGCDLAHTVALIQLQNVHPNNLIPEHFIQNESKRRKITMM